MSLVVIFKGSSVLRKKLDVILPQLEWFVVFQLAAWVLRLGNRRHAAPALWVLIWRDLVVAQTMHLGRHELMRRFGHVVMLALLAEGRRHQRSNGGGVYGL